MPRTLNIPKRSLQEIVDEQPGNTPKPEVETPQIEAPLDGAAESGQPSPVAQASEGELERTIQERLATKLGWVPLEQWKRDPSKHVSAADFLEDTPRQLEAHKERARRAAQAAEAAFEDDRRRLQTEAEAKVRAAAEAQDPEAATAAAKQLAASSGPSARVQAWVSERSWYRDDPDARAIATRASNVAAAAGLSEAEQLEAADLATKKRFPEYFGEETPPTAERQAPKETVRLSQVTPPAVHAPSRTTPSGKPNKEKGYADLPSAIRQDYERHLERKFTGRGMKVEDARANYARAYFADN